MLRVSITDRCNLRCTYCMPDGGVPFEPRETLLSPDEIGAIASVARSIGITHVKITGGEPTVRRDLLEIVEVVSRLGFEDVSMTTNGLQLDRLAPPLREAGVDRLTISLDSLQPERYERITGGGRLELVMRGIDAAIAAGFKRLKINVVVMRGINDDEIGDFAALAVDRPWTVRFIEYMPLGASRLAERGASDGPPLLENAQVLQHVEARVGRLAEVNGRDEPGVGPATVFTADGMRGRVGFISAMSRPFCETCNRMRLTARGVLRACLFDGGEIDVRPLLRPSVQEDALRAAFAACTQQKPTTHGAQGSRQMSQIGG